MTVSEPQAQPAHVAPQADHSERALSWIQRVASMRAWLFLAALILGFEAWARIGFGGTFILNPFNIQSILLNKWILYTIIILVSWLMISTIPLLNMKFKNYQFAGNKPRYILLIVSLPLIVFLGWLSVPVIFITYILVSLLFKNVTNLKTR